MFRGWLPLALMTLLMVALGAYTQPQAVRRSCPTYNLNGLGSIATLPLALVAMGQTNALMVRGFDVLGRRADDAGRRRRLVTMPLTIGPGTGCSGGILAVIADGARRRRCSTPS